MLVMFTPDRHWKGTEVSKVIFLKLVVKRLHGCDCHFMMLFVLGQICQFTVFLLPSCLGTGSTHKFLLRFG